MRKTIFALATSMLIAGGVFVGCGGDDAVNVGDMATKSDAGPITTSDGAVAKIGCGGLVTCYNDCSTTATTQAEYDTCSAACDKKAKSGSTAKYDNALACGQSHCLGNVDAGNGKCKLSADMTQLQNADGTAIASADPGTPPKECGACLNNSLAALFGTACSPTNSPDCKPAECTAITNTCLNEM
jgi:hypothetical protein